MVNKKLVIIGIQEEYLSDFTKQIQDIFAEEIKVRAITVKDLTSEMINPDETVLLSSKVIVSLVKPFIPKEVCSISIKRGINFANIKKLLDLPPGRNILIINDTKLSTEDTVLELKENVSEHNYYAYCPDEPIANFIDYVVTPGERHLIPKGVPNVIDVSTRVIDIETIFELCEHFELQEKYSLLVKRYMKNMISISTEGHDELLIIDRDIKTDNARFKFEDVIAESQEMKSTVHISKKVAISDKPIHIIGKAGSGKNMIAQAIHNESNCREGPFISINCSTRPENVLEKELFGLEKDGKYTPGLFEISLNGTLCIDEIGDMPLMVQAKLFQALEEERSLRVQGILAVPLNIRLITTSSINILDLVNKGLFRKDLFYVISTFICKVPSLKDRKEDFEPLIKLCFAKYLHREDVIIPDNIMKILKDYAWDGNVKELFNIVYYMASFGEQVISTDSIPYYVKTRNSDSYDISDGVDEKLIIEKLEKRGFLCESIAILDIFAEGKNKNTSYGRTIVKKLLDQKGYNITDQQLRLRLEVLNELDLLITRQGRLGTTISKEGIQFLEKLERKNTMQEK